MKSIPFIRVPQKFIKLSRSTRRWTQTRGEVLPVNPLVFANAVFFGLKAKALPDRVALSWILPNLAVGRKFTSRAITQLGRLKISTVVDCRNEYKDDEKALALLGIKLVHVPTPDGHPLTIEDLDFAVKEIIDDLNRGGKVYIHCQHGAGRSVMLTVAALALYKGWTIPQATQWVYQKHVRACMHPGQRMVLQDYINE